MREKKSTDFNFMEAYAIKARFTCTRTHGLSAETATISDDNFKLESCIRGHHIYKDVWTPVMNEELSCRREEGNYFDSYAVAFIKFGVIVGHVPHRISAACSLFIQRGGAVMCKVTGPQHYSSNLPQGGLEVLCRLVFCGTSKLITKLHSLLQSESPNYKITKGSECEALKLKQQM